MAMNLSDLNDATEFERWALSGLVPLPATRPHSVVKDTTKNAVEIRLGTAQISVVAGGKTVAVDILPLAFGLAWKILDLQAELAFDSSGLIPSRGQRWLFKDKVRHARAGSGSCLPLSADSPVWQALLTSYAKTTQVRHSLVHGQADFLPNGDLVGHDTQGRPLPPLTRPAQEAFCRAAQRSLNATLNGTITLRERADLAFHLDQLSVIHGLLAIGGVELDHPPLILADGTGNPVRLDIPQLLQEALSSWPSLKQFDLGVRLPDGRTLVGELEYAPKRIVEFDPAQPPDWLFVEP